MSDPQINIEIEDVLASIRRLVSEGEVPREQDKTVAVVQPESTERRRTEVPVSAPEQTANVPTAPDKLILSPDQMVAIPSAATKTEAEKPLLLTPTPQPQGDPFEHDILGDAEGPDGVELNELADPIGSQDQGNSALPADFEVPRPEDMWHSVRSHAETPDVEEPSGPAARAQLLSTIAELEAAVTETTDDFEPDGSETTPIVDWAKTTANGAIFGARASTTRIADVADPSPSEDAPAQNIQDMIADTVLKDQADQVASRLDDDLSKFLEAETVVDQAALREVVSDIVRQELQGALGERITRNVRKLVRREIYRVLASEEFN